MFCRCHTSIYYIPRGLGLLPSRVWNFKTRDLDKGGCLAHESPVLRLAMFALLAVLFPDNCSIQIFHQTRMFLDKGCLLGRLKIHQRQRPIACILHSGLHLQKYQLEAFNKFHENNFLRFIHIKRRNIKYIYNVPISWVPSWQVLAIEVMKEFKSGCVFEVPWTCWASNGGACLASFK